MWSLQRSFEGRILCNSLLSSHRSDPAMSVERLAAGKLDNSERQSCDMLIHSLVALPNVPTTAPNKKGQ
jgi:hypothetical protein